MRTSLLAVLLMGTVLSLTRPVAAGEGQPDIDNEYANVGVMIVFDFSIPPPGPPVSTFCSGVLISERHFLTAAHCVDWLSTVESPLTVVSFDQGADPLGLRLIPVVASYMHPDYPPGQWLSPGNSPGIAGLQNDLGILEFHPDYDPAAIFGILPAALPPQGLLDRLLQEGRLKKARIINVGYGVVPTLLGPPAYSMPDGTRRISTSRFVGLTRDFLIQRMNLFAGDEGSSAPGDSGSPKFLDGDDNRRILAITSWGDPANRAMGSSVRLDTAAALSFIDSVLNP